MDLNESHFIDVTHMSCDLRQVLPALQEPLCFI